jgi:hypothetical protein
MPYFGAIPPYMGVEEIWRLRIADGVMERTIKKAPGFGGFFVRICAWGV